MKRPASQLTHAPWAASGCAVPALQSMGLRAPVLQKEPPGQALHWPSLPRPGVLLKEPSVHGSGAEAPASQYEPATHSKHAVWPLAFMNVPAPQLVQLPWLVAGCTVPGLHSVGSAAPVEQNDPDGHTTQSPSLVIERLSTLIVAFWWRPDGHGSEADAPAAQYAPATHSKQAVRPCPS